MEHETDSGPAAFTPEGGKSRPMPDPDLRLARKARTGDRRALLQLYERHKSGLFGFLVRLTGSREEAEDVFQEVWIKVINGVSSYRPGPAGFRTWLYRVASNAAIDRRRREHKHEGPALDEPVNGSDQRKIDQLRSELPGPDLAGEGRILAEAMRRAAGALSERQRSAVLLRHQQGFSYAEIASALSVAEGTAKTLVHRGVQILRGELKEWFDERANL